MVLLPPNGIETEGDQAAAGVIWHPYCSFEMQADGVKAREKAVALPNSQQLA